MEDNIIVLVFGFVLIIAGAFDIKLLLAIFSYHNFFRELFGHKGLRWICVILGSILAVGSIYNSI